MIKIVTELVDQPQITFICDDRCGMVTAIMVPDPDNMANQQAAMMTAIQQGWTVRLDKQLCPHHTRERVGMKNLVQVPTSKIVVPC